MPYNNIIDRKYPNKLCALRIINLYLFSFSPFLFFVLSRSIYQHLFFPWWQITFKLPAYWSFGISVKTACTDHVTRIIRKLLLFYEAFLGLWVNPFDLGCLNFVLCLPNVSIIFQGLDFHNHLTIVFFKSDSLLYPSYLGEFTSVGFFIWFPIYFSFF